MIRTLYLWFVVMVGIFPWQAQSSAMLFNPTSPFNQPIPTEATYVPENRIGSFRPNLAEWSMPIYRVAETDDYPTVQVVNLYSDRVEEWVIPPFAEPATADDHHLGIIHYGEQMIYELWNAEWVDATTLNAGGMVAFPLDGSGISTSPDRRVTAAGFAVSAGMVVREDFLNPATGFLNNQEKIDHALSMSLPFDLIASGEFVAPAIGGETAGRATVDGIPLGAHFALPPDLPIDELSVHPFTRELLRAARDYGIYVNDTNGSPLYEGKGVGNIRVEPNLIETLYGESGDDLIPTIQEEVFAVIETYGFFRVSVGKTPLISQNTDQSDAVVSPKAVTVSEDGRVATYTLALAHAPKGEVQILVNSDLQTVTIPSELIFTPENWDIPQTITVIGYDDKQAEAAEHTGTIIHLALSEVDQGYAGIDLPAVTVTVLDND